MTSCEIADVVQTRVTDRHTDMVTVEGQSCGLSAASAEFGCGATRTMHKLGHDVRQFVVRRIHIVTHPLFEHCADRPGPEPAYVTWSDVMR